MRIADMLSRPKPSVSFEFMAPRDESEVNVLALRGDSQNPDQPFTAADPQLAHGSDLVAFVRRNGYRFGIGAACSTEKHPESPDMQHEFRYMKLKVEAGADFLIT